MAPLPLIQEDNQLEAFEYALNNRLEWFYSTKEYIENDFGSLQRFAKAHKYLGFNYDKILKGWWFREWAPNAHYISLIGDFNHWDRAANPLQSIEFGVWETFLADDQYANKLTNFSEIKIHIGGDNGQLDRIPAYIKRVVQKEDGGFNGQFLTDSTFQWSDKKFDLASIQQPLIYEAHIGMAQEEGKVGTFEEFRTIILPKVHALGYNVLQLMAVQEHPYYGSFGYHVSNFFAVSSRFGTPDDLRKLIDTAHDLGIAVIMDLVHSHAVKNREEGLAEFDGQEIYFNGWHPAWDSRLFDYGKIEVKRFLASNIYYWMDEFHFDGFRFDGITSMLYHHHGHTSFTTYQDYFGEVVNNDAILYLQLANTIIHEYNKNALSICEDMSGMPGACRPIDEGGLGFDYRLGMGIPDYWTNLLETTQDEDWNMGDMFYHLTNRRYKEKTIAYAESHDQALVGDKSIAFWLMDQEMYTHMSTLTESLVVDRGIALHKMIRFITLVLGGEAYLNFIGNEFGHPEWVDFPRKDNDWSYHYARRQWSLAETDHLKYKYLYAFDSAMIKYAKESLIMENSYIDKLVENNDDKVLIFEKKNRIYLFNFSPNSYTDYAFHTKDEKSLQVIFNGDKPVFGGFDRVDDSIIYQAINNKIMIYLPSRTCIVLKKSKPNTFLIL